MKKRNINIYFQSFVKSTFCSFVFGLILLTSACASSDNKLGVENTSNNATNTATNNAGNLQNASVDTNVYLEPYNSAVFDFNFFIDGILLQPAARLYDFVMPDFAQTLVLNFLNNFREPVYFINYLLQGEGVMAQKSFARFTFNTSFGFFGFIDIANEAGVADNKTDFGLTLARWGWKDSAYLVLPFYGSSSIRDTIGFGFDVVANPLNIVTWISPSSNISTFDWARFGTEGVAYRAEALPLTDDLSRNALDLYASVKTMYLQNRQYEVNKDKGLYKYDFEFEEEL